jgi:hypothetical protein
MGRGVTRMALIPLLALAATLLPAQSPRSYFVIVGGLGGEPEYAERFEQQAAALGEVCQKTAGDSSLVSVLSGAAATRQAIETALGRLRQQSRPEDSLSVFLLGHGTFDGRTYKFNVPGPDITEAQLKELLDAIPARRQLVVNTTSASGAALDMLKSDRRIVITATKNGREINATVFARFWLEALASPEADTDKNDTISALEAYRYAERKVKEFYDSEKRLSTEHSRLEGEMAASFVLARLGTALAASDDPRLRELLTRREELERRIDALKLRKAEMPEAAYLQELQNILVPLADTQQEIDRIAGAATEAAAPEKGKPEINEEPDTDVLGPVDLEPLELPEPDPQ